MKFSAFAGGVTAAVMLALAAPAGAQTVDAYAGDWEGVLHAGPRNLRLELHLKTSGGETTASLDSLDQSVAVSATSIASGRTVFEWRGQYAHSSLQAPPSDPIGPAVAIAGVASFGTSSGSPTARANSLLELSGSG